MPNAPYVDARRQLVLELFVRDIRRSVAFYTALGFAVERDSGDFAVLSWEAHSFLLDQRPQQAAPPARPQANVRVLVGDVDAAWERCLALGAPVLVPVADRDYGLRDFTVLDPDGFGVRFASYLPGADREPE